MRMRLALITALNLVSLYSLRKLWLSYARTRGRARKPLASSSEMLVAQTGNQLATRMPSAPTVTTSDSFKSTEFTAGDWLANSTFYSIPELTLPSPMNSGESEAGSRGHADLNND